MSKPPIWHPFTQHGLNEPIPEVSRADGAVLYRKDGGEMIDAISSWWVTTHGHAHPKIAAAIAEEAAQGCWHEAVLAAGCKVSGCTVHYADQTYDTGPIIVQMTCPVEEDDDVDSLAARVFELECHAYPQAIQLIGQGHVQVVDGRTHITPTP